MNPLMFSALSVLLTLLIGGVTVYLMRRQLDVMNRQLNVMKRQDEILNRRADLSFVIEVLLPSETVADRRLRFLVENSGSKGARDFYWHLTIPLAFSSRQNISSVRGSIGPDESLRIDGEEYRVFRELCTRPIYPNRRVVIGTLSCDNPSVMPPIKVGWKIVSEDGEFPPEAGKQEMIDVTW